MTARERVGSRPPRPRPGPDRVPPDLVERPPAHRRRADRVAGPGCRLHGDHADRDRDGGAAVLPAGHRAHLRRVVALRARRPRHGLAGAARPARPRRRDGLVHRARLGAHRAARPAVPGRDREHVPQPLPDGAHARGVRAPARLGRPGRRQAPHAARALGRAGGRVRVRAGARARPRRLALGRHDHRRPAHGLHARGGGALLVPPRDPGRHGLGLLPALQVCGRAGPRGPGAGATLIATLVAFVVGYFVIIAFLKIVSTFSYTPFVVYRLVLAALVVLLLLVGVLEPGGTAVSTP